MKNIAILTTLAVTLFGCSAPVTALSMCEKLKEAKIGDKCQIIEEPGGVYYTAKEQVKLTLNGSEVCFMGQFKTKKDIEKAVKEIEKASMILRMYSQENVSVNILVNCRPLLISGKENEKMKKIVKGL